MVADTLQIPDFFWQDHFKMAIFGRTKSGMTTCESTSNAGEHYADS